MSGKSKIRQKSYHSRWSSPLFIREDKKKDNKKRRERKDNLQDTIYPYLMYQFQILIQILKIQN